MRRPKFSRWIHKEILRIVGVGRFNMRKFAAQAQNDVNGELAAALLLYAHENDCLDTLLPLITDKHLLDVYTKVEKHLGDRSIERLALRGTPMMSLPPQYRDLMARFEEAYYTPERIAEEKRELHQKVLDAVQRSGASTAEIARELGIDRANLSAYLAKGETHRLSTEAIERLANFDAA